MAQATDGDLDRVLAQPYARTLWTLARMLELEAIKDTKDQDKQLHGALLTCYAMHDPEKLRQEAMSFHMQNNLSIPTMDEAMEKADLIALRLRQARRKGMKWQ